MTRWMADQSWPAVAPEVVARVSREVKMDKSRAGREAVEGNTELRTCPQFGKDKICW